MRSSLKNYSEYPFPLRFLLSYIVVTVAGIVLFDMLATWLIISDAAVGFFDTLFSVLFALAVYIVGNLILGGILSLLCSGRRIYRGIGLYNILLSVSAACPVIFVFMIILLNLIGNTPSFFNVIILLLECGMPICEAASLHIVAGRCSRCGLMKTMSNWKTNTESLGRRVKYHNEGGFYKDVTTTAKAREVGSLSPEEFDVTMTTRQYVPKTTVRDGEYEKRRRASSCTCCVCGNVKVSVFEYEHRIGD